MTAVTDRRATPAARDTEARGGTWRVVRTELRRGSAPVMVLVVGGVGTALLFTDPGEWAGRWYSLAAEWRSFVPAMGPLAAAIGAWQGGRATRRRTTELTASTARTPELRGGLGWIVAAAAAGVGALAPWVLGAVAVAPVATYGGSWWWTVVGGVVGVMAFALVGAVFGSRRWSVLDPPLVGLVAVLLTMFTGLGWSETGTWVLSGFGPGVVSLLGPASYVTAGTTAAQVAWFGGAAALVLVLATSKRRRALVAAAAVALGGAVGLVTQSDPLKVDDDALTLVCEGSAPELCVAQEKAFLLDGVGDVVADATARWASFDDMPDRIIDVPSVDWEWPPPEGVDQFDVSDAIGWRGTPTDEGRASIAYQIAETITLVPLECANSAPGPDAATAGAAAGVWPHYVADPGTAEHYLYGENVEEFRRLIARSDSEQIDWIGRYRDAVRSCDAAALEALGRELRP